jgi:hypothetical protein
VRLFKKSVRKALEHAAEGGQALHVFPATRELRRRAPLPFKRTDEWGHLFDQDRERLIKTARALGVRVVVVDRRDTPYQHIDLCGGPLRKAMALCGG